jgi:hypothetical protein
MKDALVASGVIGKERVVVTGQARSDLIGAQERVTSEQKTILYFEIGGKAGLVSALADAESDETWGELPRNVYHALCRYVEKHDSIRLVVKTKGKPINNYNSRRVIHYYGPPDLGLLSKADVVVGFNTTALIESVLAGVPAISAEINLRGLPSEKRFEYYGCVSVATTIDELNTSLDLALQGTSGGLVASNKKLLVERYLGNSDGHAGERLRQFLELT